MTNRAGRLQIAALAIAATFIGCAAAQAAASRYVSVTGRDAGNCLYARPCRTLQYAVTRTPKGGEIHLLNSGEYGVVATLRKPITISGGGNTIERTAIVVRLYADVVFRDLIVNCNGGTYGIHVIEGGSVHIEHSVVHGCSSDGVLFESIRYLFVTDSVFRGNAGSGVDVRNSSVAFIERSRFEYNHGNGVQIDGASAAVSNSVAARNDEAGYLVLNGQLTLKSSVVAGNNVGLNALASSTARISDSVVTGNATGIQVSGSTVLTRQNNTVSGNSVDISGSLTPLGGV